MREGELFGLVWDCVDFKRRTVTVAQQLREDASGQHRLRSVPFACARNDPEKSGHGRITRKSEPV
jgi:hypothetical protein